MNKELFNIISYPEIQEDKTIKQSPSGIWNYLFEGENLHCFPILEASGIRPDIIYIDPPYNTGNKDFKYNDRFVDKDDRWRHKKWVQFMKVRLVEARRLLTDNGVIFISIDDNEQANLKLLCDEIFGENNFIANFICAIMGGKNDSFTIKKQQEYVLLYAKDINNVKINKIEEIREKDLYLDLKKGGTKNLRSDRPNLYYPIYYNLLTQELDLIKNDNTIEILPILSNGQDGRWRWSKKKFEEEKHTLIVKKQRNDNFGIFTLNPKGENISSPFGSILNFPNSQGTKELKEIFGNMPFDFPKSVELLKHLLKICSDKNSIILDFFAGTGTTGQAVLELNEEDGGNRRFALVTNNESEICSSICYPRLKAVMEGYTNQKGELVEGLGGNLKYVKIKNDPCQSTGYLKLHRIIQNYARKSIDILKIKHQIFDEIQYKEPPNGRYRIFRKDREMLCVIFDIDNLDEFLQKLKNAKGFDKFYLYVFAYYDDLDLPSYDWIEIAQDYPLPIFRIFERIIANV